MQYIKNTAISIFVAASVIAGSLVIQPAVYAADNTVLVHDTFDSVTAGDENLLKIGDMIDGAFNTSYTTDVGGRKQFADLENNEVKVVDDETGNGRGNVLKLVSDNASVFPTLRYLRPMAVTNAAVPHEPGKQLVVKMDMYFDSATAFGYKLSSDGRNKYISKFDGKTYTWPCLTQSQSGFVSILGAPWVGNRSNYVATIAFDNSAAASWEDASYIPAIINTRQSANDNANNMAVKTAGVKLPTDKWFEVSFIFDITKIDNATHCVPLSVYVDGKQCLDNYPALMPSANDYMFATEYAGMVFAPIAYVDENNCGAVKPVMYVDDIEVANVSPYEPELKFEINSVVESKNTDVAPDSRIILEFEEDIDEEASAALREEGAITLTDEFGKSVTPENITVSGNTASFDVLEKLAYSRTYRIDVKPLNITNSYHIKCSGLSAQFSTEKSVGAYITDYDVTYTGTSVDTAERISVSVKTSDETNVLAAFFKDNAFAGLSEVQTAQGQADLSFDGSADYIELMLLDNNGKNICDSVIYNPLGKTIPTAEDKKSDALSVSVYDAESSVMQLAGSTGSFGSNQYGRIEIYTDKKASVTDYDRSSALLADDIEINAQGYFTKNFSFKQPSGVYYVWVITNGREDLCEFDYVSASDIFKLLRNISITDNTDAEYIPQESLYRECERFGSGFGIDFDSKYTSQRDKDLFAYRLNSHRSEFKTGEADELIAKFVQTEKKIAAEVDFLKKLENPLQKSQIEYILKENADMCNIDFSSYASIPGETYDAFVGATFKNADEVKPFFETALANALKNTTSGGGGGSGGSGSSPKKGTGGGSVSASQMNDAVNNRPEKETAEFNDLEGYEWAKDAIVGLMNKKIVSGVGDKKFAPSAYVTREQFVKMLVLATAKYNSDAKCAFGDVSENDWSYPYIASAVSEGIISGVSESEFGHGADITRQDMAVIIYRIINSADDAQSELDKIAADTTIFADIGSVSEYALSAVKYLKDEGLVAGRDDGRFAPKDFVSRAEAAVMISRIMEYIK